MRITSQASVVSLWALFALFACSDRNESPIPNESSVSANEEPITDKWLGEWTGPEGTFLRLAGGKGKYEIVIQNLDGPKNYQGSSVGDQIQFERNGEKQFIRATGGVETGMKWLTEKTNCLTIVRGEGYCRN